MIQIKLTITDLDYSSWSTQGQDGVWLGIGFGSDVMSGADIIQCQFLFSGISASNNFICSDRIGTTQSNPGLDSVKDVTDIETTRSYDDVNKLATLSAKFSRKLDTKDVNEDYRMRDGDTFDAIWAWGEISSGTP